MVYRFSTPSRKQRFWRLVDKQFITNSKCFIFVSYTFRQFAICAVTRRFDFDLSNMTPVLIYDL